jgi:hypothetical protein
MPDAKLPVLVFVRDMIFASKIRATAQSLGASVQMLRDASQLAGAHGRKLIVDLNQSGVIELSAEWGRATGKDVIGFVSHTDSATIEAARAAGITQVLPRSRFVQVLAELLAG